MTRRTTDPLRVRLDTTAPRPTFVDDEAGDYLVSYSPAALSPAAVPEPLLRDIELALDAFDPMAPGWPDFGKSLAGLDALRRLRAALAQPEPLDRMPCLIQIDGSLASGCLIPGTVYRVIEVREHWPTGEPGEGVTTVIRFDPAAEETPR